MSTDATVSTPALDVIESAKRKAAFRAVDEHFSTNMQFVGIGSGSTIIYGVEAIKAKIDAHPLKDARYIFFVPTGRLRLMHLQIVLLTVCRFPEQKSHRASRTDAHGF